MNKDLVVSFLYLAVLIGNAWAARRLDREIPAKLHEDIRQGGVSELSYAAALFLILTGGWLAWRLPEDYGLFFVAALLFFMLVLSFYYDRFLELVRAEVPVPQAWRHAICWMIPYVATAAWGWYMFFAP
jgi:hypothetical protein